MRMRMVLTVLSCVCLHSCASRLFAWGTLTHCVLARESGSTIGPGFHNAPDFWKSAHIFELPLGVTNEFCWTHEVRRTAPVGWLLRRVNVPSYYSDPGQEQDNSASIHMDIICQSKLRPDRVTASMNQVRVGWAAHNREDQATYGGNKAHFHLFPGPQGPEPDVGEWLKHARNEKYCDALLYVVVIWGGDVDVAFDGTDPFAPPTGFPPEWDDYLTLNGTGDDDSDGLLCLGMKVFRKKQQTVDTEVLEGLHVQDRAAVTQTRLEQIPLPLKTQLLQGITRGTYDDAQDWLENDLDGLGQQAMMFYWAAVFAAGD